MVDDEAQKEGIQNRFEAWKRKGSVHGKVK
jgi:hypothetical protein